jgi:hypothetical protein
MLRHFVILAAFAIAMAWTAPAYSQCANGRCARPVQAFLQAAPARKAVRATAHVAATAVRTSAKLAAAPVRFVGHAAHRAVERRPARRALRGAARVVFRPLARIRFACQ